RAQQDYYRQYRDFQKEGMLDDETKAKLDYWYTNEIRALENKASKARGNEDDKYLKRPESAQGRPLDLGITVDEQKIQNQLSQQLSGEGKELVDQMFSLGNSAQTASEAQDSLAQSAQQTADSFQKIEGDRLVEDIQNLSTSTQQLTDLQAQLAEATKAGISAFQGSEQNTASKQADTSSQPDTAKTAQNRLAEKVRESVQNLRDGSNTSTKEKSLPLTTDKAHGENPANSRSFFEKKFADTRDERLNAPEKISLDDGALANIDLSEIVSPLSGIESNVQGIRDILQGNNAVKDANAEATPDTSENSSPDLLSPLNAINETAKSILGELQSRHDENDSIGELKSELSTQLSDAASQLSENLASPIQDIAQKLQDTQDNNVDDKISEISSTLSNDVAAKIQEVTQTLQARNADESAGEGNEEVTRLDDIATKVQSIFDEMRAQQTAELETQSETPTESADYLTPLTNIRDNVSGILNKLQETTQDTAQTVNLSEILSPITQNINAPLSDLRVAIDNK
ncbi:MAG: hypothetical protein IKP64_07240, partial [Selenomonadaceae bacterium]|nr:hypothetical protein [Selenomonadaceae bacterium]